MNPFPITFSLSVHLTGENKTNKDARLIYDLIWCPTLSQTKWHVKTQLTFGADPSEVCDFHQHARKHVRLVWAPAAGVHLQSLQQGLLQLVYLLRLFQVHTVWNNDGACTFQDAQNVKRSQILAQNLRRKWGKHGCLLMDGKNKTKKLTGTDEADCAEEACLCVIHFKWQQLTSKSKHQVCEWAEASIMHLGPVKSQAIWEGHRVLFWCVTGAYPQHLRQERILSVKH